MSDACIFCKIASHEIPSQVVWEDDQAIAFHDRNPKAKVHVLLIPKAHIESLVTVGDSDASWLGTLMVNIQKIARQLGIVESGFQVRIRTGRDGGQEVGHLHIHIMGGEHISG
jgi:histidine triad (HIT) family protein